MLSHENAYFEFLASNSVSAMAHNNPDSTSKPLPPRKISADSPSLPRPPPRPKPPRFVLKSAASLNSDQLTPKVQQSYRNSFLEAQRPPFTLSPLTPLTTPVDPGFFQFEQEPTRRHRAIPVDNMNFMKSLNIDEVRHKQNKHSSHMHVPLTPNHTVSPSLPPIIAPPSLSTLPIQELNGSPYSVKKKFKIGKHIKKNKYSPSHSPVLTPAHESKGAPSLTKITKSASDSPNNLSPYLKAKQKSKQKEKQKEKQKDNSHTHLNVIPDNHHQAFSSLPIRVLDTPSKTPDAPALLKSYSEVTGPKSSIPLSPSLDNDTDPSVEDISSLRLVTKLSSQFEVGPQPPPNRTRTRSNTSSLLEKPSLASRHALPVASPRDSYLESYILVDRPSTPPSSASGTVENSSSSASDMEQFKRGHRQVYSADDLSEALTSSSSTSVFIHDGPTSIPCIPSANPTRTRPWDQVNRAFGKLLGGNAPPTYVKRLDPTQSTPVPATPTASVTEDEEDQGGAIIVRSRRPAHEIFRESVRIKKKERQMLRSMTDANKKEAAPSKAKSEPEPEPEGDCEQKMFLYVIVVSLTKSLTHEGYEPCISYRFPPMNDNSSTGSLLAAVPQFCFPDARLWQPSTLKPSHNHLSETYSFLLTDELGGKKFGYCRRILPKGKDLPEVYCIISPLGCFSLYSSILDQVEAGRARSSALVYAFLRSVISHPLPLPGHSVSIKSMISQSKEGMGQISLFRPQDSARLEHVSFSKLLCCLGIKLTLQLFAAILLERRIIFVAEQLSLLSSCCHSITALLYPFSWQHVFIPVLPEAMVHICCSPSPYIVGLLPSSLPTVLELGEEMEEAVIFSLDERKFIRKAGDEESILPSKLQAVLESVLRGCDELDSWRDTPEMSDVVIEAFVRFFIEILDMYTEFTEPNSEDPTIIEFNTKAFLKTIKSKASRRFLSEFCKTQMFFNFLQEQGDNPEFSQSIKTLFQERYDEIMSNRVLSAKYGKEGSKGLLKKFRLGRITGYTPGKTK